MTELQDVLDFIESDRTLVVTERLSETEYGAAMIVARDVRPSFGLWAQQVWNHPPVDVDGLARAIMVVYRSYPEGSAVTADELAERIATEYRK